MENLTPFEWKLNEDRKWTDDWRRVRRAAIGSGLVHVVLVSGLWVLPESAVVPRAEPEPAAQRVTHLLIPADLTQKAPNAGKISKQLTLESIAPQPALKAVAREARPARPVPAAVAPPPVAALQPPRVVLPEVPKALPQPKIEEPPRLPTSEPQQVARLVNPVAPPPEPPLQNAGPPKLAFENVTPQTRGPATGRALGIPLPGSSVQEAVKALRTGPPLAQSVGDTDEGPAPGMNLPPSAGRPRSNLELKSDPMGVDFRPYLVQVLAAVRRNWFAVFPEAARLGQRGQVVLQFAIAKQGGVTKVIFNGESGAKALDQAAVAAISASNPLPPLPAEFKGDRVVLQMTFSYNMPR